MQDLLQENKHSKLTIGAFFDFMRTAYQVNDSAEDLATILSANSEIDWHELAKIDLNLEKSENNQASNITCFNSQEQRKQDKDSIQDLLLQRINNISTETSPYTSESMMSSQFSTIFSNSSIQETCRNNNFTQESNAENLSIKCFEIGNNTGEIKKSLECKDFNEKRTISSQSNGDLEERDYGLAKIMKENLRDVLHEGLLDSVLPYMFPKSTLSQPIIKKTPATDVKKNCSLGNIGENKAGSSTHKEKDKEKNKTLKKLSE